MDDYSRRFQGLGDKSSEGVLRRYSGSVGETTEVRSSRNDLKRMTLRGFISEFHEELEDYYGPEFCIDRNQLVDDCDIGDTVIFCLVDDCRRMDLTWVPPHQQKNIRRSGKWRRDKIRHKWAYTNPLNRIHGYIILKDLTNKEHREPVLSIAAVCSTYFTDKRGIGVDLMDLAREYGEVLGYRDIILEVANDYSWNAREESSDEESSDEESSDEESSDEDSSDWDEESGDEDEISDLNTIWYPCESATSILSSELWRKCMRKDLRGNPVYNLDQPYIEEEIKEYMNCSYNSGDDGILWEGCKANKRIENEPGENDYGGFWYKKGKRSQEKLMKFYERNGYREDPDIHLNWCCFSEIPYPTMRLTLE